MKKLTGTIIIMVITLSSVFAQGRKKDKMPEMFERMRAEKISFITAELDLTPEEAQVFWPVYNEFEKKRFAMQQDKREKGFKGKKGEKPEEPSEAELKKMNEEFINSFEKEASLMKEYNKKFLEVLPIQKVMKLYKSERGFRSHMLREFRNRGPKGGTRGDRPERGLQGGNDMPEPTEE